MPEGTRHDQKWRISVRDIVEMNPERHHSREEFGGWHDVMHAAVPCSGATALAIPAFPDANCAIRVPSQPPIEVGRLVEEDRPNRLASWTQNRRGDGTDHAIRREKRPERGNAGQTQFGAIAHDRQQQVRNANISLAGATCGLVYGSSPRNPSCMTLSHVQGQGVGNVQSGRPVSRSAINSASA